jgi:hypothetical protein
MKDRIFFTFGILIIILGMMFACIRKNPRITTVEKKDTIVYNYSPLSFMCIKKLYQDKFVYNYPELAFEYDTVSIPAKYYKLFMDDLALYKNNKEPNHYWWIWYAEGKINFIKPE